MIKEEQDRKLKEAFKDKPLIVHVDETTDRKGQAVFITLFRILPNQSCVTPKLLVAGVTTLTSCNAQQTAQAILQVIFIIIIIYV